jgi:hypothetical protein
VKEKVEKKTPCLTLRVLPKMPEVGERLSFGYHCSFMVHQITPLC